jgi:hypothetical protein
VKKKNPLHYNSITVLSFYLLPLLFKVAVQLSQSMNQPPDNFNKAFLGV